MGQTVGRVSDRPLKVLSVGTTFTANTWSNTLRLTMLRGGEGTFFRRILGNFRLGRSQSRTVFSGGKHPRAHPRTAGTPPS